MGRFLLFFSYIGTHYRGMQIQRLAGEVITRFKTVQGVLEEHLQKLNPVNEVKVKTSSRTDSNVHALCNTCHVDLIHRHHPLEFNPFWVTAKLNKTLSQSNERLRILNTVRVHDNFSSRMEAGERRYIYRLAVVKSNTVFTDPSRRGLPWTPQDAEQCSLVFAPFNTDQFLRAAEILCGTHNFLSFSTRNILKAGPKVIPHTQMSIRIERGSALMGEHRRGVSDVLDFWEVHFHGQSFLYRQVRRMMGAMVAVAQGQMTLQQLQYYLDHPSLCNPGAISALTANGLTLKEVHYPPHVFNYSPAPVPSEEEQEDDNLQAEDKSRLKETVQAPATVTALTNSSPLTVTSLAVSSSASAVTTVCDSSDNSGTCVDDAKWVTGIENCASSDLNSAADLENCTSGDVKFSAGLENCATGDVKWVTDLENCATDDVECAGVLENCATGDVECAADLENCAASDVKCATDLENCANTDVNCATDLEDCATSDAECATDLENCANTDVNCATYLEDCATSDAGCATDLENRAAGEAKRASRSGQLRNQ